MSHSQNKPAGLALEQAADDRQHQQGKRVGNRRAAHRDADAALARDAVAYHDRVSHQRVRGIHAGQQDGRKQAVLQEHHVGHHADAYRDDKGQQAQGDGFPAVFLEVGHVHLQPGKEHDVEQPHLAEQLKTAVAHQNVEPMLAHGKPRQNHADDVRDAQLGQQQRGKEYDEQHQEEYPGRVGDRQFQTEVKPVHKLYF